MRVLWVENHGVFARLAGRQFLAAHELTVVPSLAAARVALAAAEFDAVLLDYDLEDGKGTTLVADIRRLPRPPVVIAASAHDAGNEALVQAGAGACCPKLRFADVETVLTGALRARSAAGRGATPDRRPDSR